MLSATDDTALGASVDEVRRTLEATDGFEVVGGQDGHRILAGGGTGPEGADRFAEHFGFLDGLSRPGIERYNQGTNGEILPSGEFVLGYPDVDGDTAGRDLPPGLARNGSYLVYRKLEQDVPAFRELTADLGRRLKGGAEEAAAKLIGRWPDGTALTEPTTGSRFGYATDVDGRRCPVGAHVRRGNPRDALPDGRRLTRRHQMLRRGIPYGPVLPEGDVEQSEPERGLLFLAVVGDIGRQFEFVQTEWMADGNAFGLGGEQDVLTTAGGADARIVVQGSPPVFVPIPRPVVTCRGGDYFFIPGITALRALGVC
jgi:Dyp-type peroxidase family